MTLYHFCPAHMVRSIRREGITLGSFPFVEDGITKPILGCQWLTKEKDRRKQSWATKRLIRYDRTAYRLTVEIPASHRNKLMLALAYVINMTEENRKIVEDYPGSDQWFVFLGRIPPKWIIGYHKLTN